MPGHVRAYSESFDANSISVAPPPGNKVASRVNALKLLTASSIARSQSSRI